MTAVTHNPRAPGLRRLGTALFILAGVWVALGFGGTIIGLVRSFKAVERVNPADKATILANGISEAMNNAAYGFAAGLITTVAGVGVWLISRRRAKALPRA